MKAKIFLTTAVIALALSARANLICNGDFTGSDGSASCESWLTIGEVQPNCDLGLNCVRGTTTAGVDATLSQAIDLTGGTQFQLTFFARSTQGIGTGSGIGVRLDDDQIFSNVGNLPSEWTRYSLIFNSTNQRSIQFDLTDHNSMVSLTDVSVSAVPEPASLTSIVFGASLFTRKKIRSDRRNI